MALNLLASKTVRYEVSDMGELVVGPMKTMRKLRLLSDVMVFICATADGARDANAEGYPLVDFSSEIVEIPAGHYLHILGSEGGWVWVTEV